MAATDYMEPVQISSDAGILGSPKNAVAVTPSNSTVLANCRYLYVGVAGNVTVDTVGGQTNVLFANVPVGVLPIQATKVYATGTTASSIVAMY